MSNFMSFTQIALKNLFSKPATTAYPAVPKTYPERSRGHIEIDMDNCILCGMCSRNCPPRAITVDRAAGKWEINRFDCVQCGYCTNVCPKKCLSIISGYTEPQSVKAVSTYSKPPAPPKPAVDPAAAAAKTAAGKKDAAQPSER